MGNGLEKPQPRNSPSATQKTPQLKARPGRIEPGSIWERACLTTTTMADPMADPTHKPASTRLGMKPSSTPTPLIPHDLTCIWFIRFRVTECGRRVISYTCVKEMLYQYLFLIVFMYILCIYIHSNLVYIHVNMTNQTWVQNFVRPVAVKRFRKPGTRSFQLELHAWLG